MQQFGLHAEAGRDVWLTAFTQLSTMMEASDARVAALTAQVAATAGVLQANQITIADLELKVGAAQPGAVGQPHDKTKFDLSEWKSFGSLERFSGDEKALADWEFKFQTFVRPLKQFESYLDWIKERDDEITVQEWTGMKANVDLAHGAGVVKLDWYDDQLYSVLSLLCTDSALAAVKNVRDEYGVRGAKAYWKITREVASKSGVRLERLADIVHHPKQITDYKMGKQMLEHCEAKRKELEKIEGQPLSDLTKRTTLKKMLPADLLRDLERDRTLKTWQEAWNFVLEQIPLRRDWSKKQSGHAMDLDAVEQQPAAGYGWDDEAPTCGACEEPEQGLDTFKGGVKGGGGAGAVKFQGNCSFCNTWGHKRAECRKYTAYLQSMGKGDKGAGEKGVNPYNKGAQKG